MAVKFSESIRIKGRSAQVFDYTQDYKNRLKWDTFLIQAELINASRADKGVRAWCVAKNGLGMETEYVSFNRPKVTAVKMTKGPRMFSDFAASWNFKDIDEHTLVTFVYSFKLRFPFSLFAPITKGVLRRNVRQRLKDLKLRFEELGQLEN
ncbi:hypothetical protein WSM22_10060 [Cytophagales bacterium WSM2-2]|nr:hypothetical protein WSM22_10060 [Cytophagales bacterium WSM2-2]